MSATDKFSQPVDDGNRRTARRAQRPDPDAPATSQPADPATAVQPEPAAPPAVDPASQPAEQPDAAGRELAATTPAPPTFASKLASNAPGGSTAAAADGGGVTLTLDDLLRMRSRRVDPFNDYVPDGTRLLRFLKAAIDLYADLSGRTNQQVVRDALLGADPIPAEVLDRAFMVEYGYDRPADVPGQPPAGAR